MKKTISAIILSALLLVSFSACNKANKAEETPALGSSQSEQSAIENSTPDESNKAKNPEKSEAESKLEQSESTVNKPFDGTLSEVPTDNPSATESKAEEKKPTTSKPSESKPADEPSSSPTTPKPTESEEPTDKPSSPPAESSEPADEPTSKPVEVSKPNHTHSYTSKVVAPTCTSKGYTLYTCTCGDSYKDSYTDKLKHTWVKGSTVKPTCDSNGYTNYTCSVCGVKGEANETKALGHKWEKVKTVKATCTKDGYTQYKCTNCGETKKGKVTKATGHSWSKWKTTKKATEKAEGKKERKCSVCGKNESKSIAKVDKYAAYRAPYDFDKIYDDMVAYGKSKGLIYDKSLWVKFNPENGWDYKCNAGFYEPISFDNPNNGFSVKDGKPLYNAAMENIDYLIERMNLRAVPLDKVGFNPFIARTSDILGDEVWLGVLYG